MNFKIDNDDFFNSKNWRECDIEHSFVQFDFNNFFDEIDYKRFFTCVYFKDLTLIYLFNYKMSMKNMSKTFSKDVNENDSIDIVLNQQRRNRDLTTRIFVDCIYDLQMTREDDNTILYALKKNSINEKIDSSSSQNDFSMLFHVTNIEFVNIVNIHVDRINDRNSSSNVIDTLFVEFNCISRNQQRESSTREEIFININFLVANTSMTQSIDDNVAKFCQSTQHYSFFFRNRKFETFSMIKIALMRFETTLFLQYLVLWINLVVCLIFYVEFQSICSNIYQNFICVISKTSWMIEFCFFESIVDMKDAMKIFDQFIKIDKKNETTLILSQVFEHLHINLTIFESLIVHSDFFCKFQLINEISLFLIKKRNVNDELQTFTLELIELMNEIFYEIKSIFDDLLTLTWQWKFYH